MRLAHIVLLRKLCSSFAGCAQLCRRRVESQVYISMAPPCSDSGRRGELNPFQGRSQLLQSYRFRMKNLHISAERIGRG